MRMIGNVVRESLTGKYLQPHGASDTTGTPRLADTCSRTEGPKSCIPRMRGHGDAVAALYEHELYRLAALHIPRLM